MDCSVDQVAGLRGIDAGLEGLLVAHLAHEHDVRVLADQGAQRDLEVQAVDADLTLVHRRLFVGEDVLDRVFDRDDVDGLALVHVVEHGGDGGGLARAGHAAEEHDALRLHGDLGHDVREEKLLELADVGGDATGGHGQLAAGLEEVHAETGVLVVVVGEVHRAEVVEVLYLLFAEDVLGDRHELLTRDGRGVQGLEGRRGGGSWASGPSS